MTEEVKYINTKDLLTDASTIIEQAKVVAYRSVNVVLVKRNWLLGKRISEEMLCDQTREELYGQNIVTNLAKQLTEQYGSGFDRGSLYMYVRFYQCFPNIVDTVCKQSFLLTWSHYRTLLQVDDEVARQWYENEATREVWSVRTLQRNISSQYYYRVLQSVAVHVNTEMLEFYWSLGRDLVQKKVETQWGSGVVEQLSLDLKDAFPGVKGFSTTNIWYSKKWYLFYSEEFIKLQQSVGEISMPKEFGAVPWGQQLERFQRSCNKRCLD